MLVYSWHLYTVFLICCGSNSHVTHLAETCHIQNLFVINVLGTGVWNFELIRYILDGYLLIFFNVLFESCIYSHRPAISMVICVWCSVAKKLIHLKIALHKLFANTEWFTKLNVKLMRICCSRKILSAIFNKIPNMWRDDIRLRTWHHEMTCADHLIMVFMHVQSFTGQV